MYSCATLHGRYRVKSNGPPTRLARIGARWTDVSPPRAERPAGMHGYACAAMRARRARWRARRRFARTATARRTRRWGDALRAEGRLVPIASWPSSTPCPWSWPGARSRSASLRARQSSTSASPRRSRARRHGADRGGRGFAVRAVGRDDSRDGGRVRRPRRRPPRHGAAPRAEPRRRRRRRPSRSRVGALSPHASHIHRRRCVLAPGEHPRAAV